MCSKSYTAEALVPANALTAKKNKVKKKPKVYRSSKLWSMHTARRRKVDVFLLDRVQQKSVFTVPVYTPH